MLAGFERESNDQNDDSYEPTDKRMSYRYGKRMTYRYGKRAAMPYRFGKRSVKDIQEIIDHLKEKEKFLKQSRSDKRMSYRYGRNAIK